MQDHQLLPKSVIAAPEGWAAADLPMFRFLVDHTPPRPCGYFESVQGGCTGLEVRGAVARGCEHHRAGYRVSVVAHHLHRYLAHVSLVSNGPGNGTQFPTQPLCAGLFAGLGRPVLLLQISLAQFRLADVQASNASILSLL